MMLGYRNLKWYFWRKRMCRMIFDKKKQDIWTIFDQWLPTCKQDVLFKKWMW